MTRAAVSPRPDLCPSPETRMCEHHLPDDDTPALPTRRRLLQGAATLAGGLLLGGPGQLLRPGAAGAAGAPEVANAAGLLAYRHAMHVHTSFSEGAASLEAQIAEAVANGFDTMWTTDHDWRMNAYGAPDVFHFTGLTETVQGSAFTWRPSSTGAPARTAGAIVGPPGPADPTPGAGALEVGVTSSGTAEATYRYELDGTAANDRQRTNIAGLVLVAELQPQLGSPEAAAVLDVQLSYRPAAGGRTAGRFQISYRFGTQPGSRSVSGRNGVVRVQVVDGAWNAVTVDPAADAAVLWPDVPAHDHGLVRCWLGAASSRQAGASVRWSYLRFVRTTSEGDAPLATQRALLQEYATRFPQLRVEQGVEVSGTSEHTNWFGGDLSLIDYRTARLTGLRAWSTALIHERGGLASLNHPFGSVGGNIVGSPAAQTSARRKTAARLIASRVDGVDLLEVGYQARGRVDLLTHLALADTLWRAGNWLTVTGVNDNHNGTVGTWGREENRFYTSVWQADPGGPAALDGLRAGAAFVGELTSFRGLLDLSAEGTPMGSASVLAGVPRREVTVTGVDLPTGSVVEVVRGPVDYGTATDPGSVRVAELPASAFVTGSAGVAVDTSTSCFVRVQVRTLDGRRVALSNPVFLLAEEPPAGRELPAARRPVGPSAG